MRDTALHARLGGRDSVTIRIDVQPKWLALTGTILGGVAVALAGSGQDGGDLLCGHLDRLDGL